MRFKDNFFWILDKTVVTSHRAQQNPHVELVPEIDIPADWKIARFKLSTALERRKDLAYSTEHWQIIPRDHRQSLAALALAKCAAWLRHFLVNLFSS